jgi:hypothetical protein
MENNANDKGEQNTGGNIPPQQPQAPYGYYPYYQPPPPTKRSDKPRMAGGLLIVTGILGLILGIMMIAGGTYMMNVENLNMNDWGQVDISGVVLASDSTPISNATVSVEGTHISVTTDALGHYQMLGVPGGYQNITLQKIGYNTIIRNVYIVPDGQDSSTAWGNQMVITEDTELNYTMTVGSETFIYGDEGNMMSMEGMESIVMLFGVVFVICAIGSIIGGSYALKSEKYPVTIIGAVMGIFSVGFGVGSILAIIALLILILSSNEFNGKR